MTSICVFCCTRIKSDKYDDEGIDSDEILKKFLKVTQTHFGINVTNTMEHEEFNFCLKCEQSLKAICQLYQELESIRLKMEWEFGALISKMEAVVGRTPSKVKWLRRNQPADDFQRMANFRDNFISKGKRSY